MVVLIPATATFLIVSLGAGAPELWRDEHATWWAATIPFEDLLRLLRNVDVVLAPYYLAMRGWIAVFGDTEFALRLPSLIAAAVCAGLTAHLARTLFDAPTGFLAGLIFAVLPAVSLYASEARPYMAAMAFTVLATVLLIRAFDQPSPVRWVLYATAIALAGLSHLVSLLVLPAHALTSVIHGSASDASTWQPRFRAAVPWLLAVLVATFIVVPIVALGTRQTEQISWMVGGLGGLARMADALQGSAGVVAIVALLAVIGLAHRRWPVVLLAVWAVAPFVLTYVAFDVVKLFLARYLLFTLPALVILASAGAMLVVRRARSHRMEWAMAVGSSVLLLLVLAGWQEHGTVRGDAAKDDAGYRDAARYVAARLGPGDGVVYQSHARLRRAMAYEWRDQPVPRDLLLSVTPQQRGSFDALECRPIASCLDDAPRIWLVILHRDGSSLRDAPGEKGDALRARYREVGSVSFRQLQVVELVLASGTANS